MGEPTALGPSPTVAYVFLPRLPLQRLVVEQPSLRGQPLVLTQRDGRGIPVVQFASSAALRRGVRVGQTGAAASALVPALVQRPYDEAREVAGLLSVGEALLTFGPSFQRDGVDGLWLDASAAGLFGGPAAWAEQVLTAVRAHGFEGLCVVGHERFCTQAVARFGDGPQVQCLPPRGGAPLAALPLTALEHGWLGDDETAPLRVLGLTSLGELRGIAPQALLARFGAAGHHAARLCRGEDESSLLPEVLPQALEERVALDWPVEQLEPLLFALKMAVDRLCARLHGRQEVAVRLTAALLLEHGAPTAVPLVLARPTSSSKLLVELLRHRLTELTVKDKVAGVHVLVEETSADPGRQLRLGDAPAGDVELEVVLARLQSALGPQALFSPVTVAKHRPEEAWSTTRFQPPDAGRLSDVWGQPEDVQWTLGEGAQEPAPPRPPTPPRPVAPPPLPVSEHRLPDPYEATLGWANAAVHRAKRPAKVEVTPTVSVPLGAQRPARLFRAPTKLLGEVSAEGQLVSLTVVGRRRAVQGVWGPERLAGDWWAQDAFARDYFRVQVEGVGLLWVFRDGHDGQLYAQGVFD